MPKERLDKILAKQDQFRSRSQAKRAIMAGLVYVNDQQIDKAGTQVDTEADIRVKQDMHSYVSRGGLKLEKAIKEFNLDLSDKIVVDIGASTGGFTDCSLQNGAQKVYAIDVGYNQLAWKLRSDDRVVVMEKTNARYLEANDIAEQGDIGVVDVAFISLTKILPALQKLLKDDSEIVTLIKPQFEAGPDKVGNNGVVKDPAIHKEVINKILDFAVKQGLTPEQLSYSPITGGKGHNIEYLAYFKCGVNDEEEKFQQEIKQVIKEAHNSLQ
ncbi:TlyA family RNA methyltransferase [Halanaerobacter jeridensis]|uniref:23S rRNA (Cytidine1920-2'-O)/16S rRNA (Cytidine1409-2'-O)-methyltransferase n=1 Tax=Halanaerobacter jeridensis TaxID=706427 RepID=A0A938XQ66_9FIRM|nr:TlyA family RNA methyltransferase [Halanaerobacter jeridensis]MBM7555243.1 23S rRNA (cytidine1920-2'-O)/16S rRNA (cytidine1409-2'-O)-methyltransferase [Halanaerobacter jeridensis]